MSFPTQLRYKIHNLKIMYFPYLITRIPKLNI